jgi:hypothetical protein
VLTSLTFYGARLNKGLAVISVSVAVSVDVTSTGGLLLLNRQSSSPVAKDSILFSAQLLLFELPLPTFFCLISWSVLVSLSSAYANGDVVNIPVNAPAIKTAATAIALLFM